MVRGLVEGKDAMYWYQQSMYWKRLYDREVAKRWTPTADYELDDPVDTTVLMNLNHNTESEPE